MKTTPKQTTEEAAVKPSVLDKTQNCAIVKIIASQTAINMFNFRVVPECCKTNDFFYPVQRFWLCVKHWFNYPMQGVFELRPQGLFCCPGKEA